MPTSGIDLYHMQDTRKNFDAMRPAPICADANQFKGQCQNIHISNNCYYGYHNTKTLENAYMATDCEMMDASTSNESTASVSAAPPQSNARKRSADDRENPMTKRFRQEVQKERNIEPETNETLKVDTRSEDLLETLYWNIHGGNMFHLVQCL